MTPGERIRARRAAMGLSQAELGRAIGVAQATIDKIEGDRTRRSRHLPLLAAKLGIPLVELDAELAALGRAASGSEILGDKMTAPGHDFPIHASAEGGPGEVIVSSDPVDWMPRPSPVAQVKGAYGVYVTGNSMAPEFEPGDIALVNPHLPLIGDKTCIFYAERDGETRATIKRLRKTTSDQWLVRQWNPLAGMKADFALSRKVWTIVHRAFGKYSRG